MSKITPELIKELRERTGVGMGKCKEALVAASGDIELAIANLRKAGAASAVKKEGRATNEGVIATAEIDGAVALVEVLAETDFVVKNEKFQTFANKLADEAARSRPSSLEQFLAHRYTGGEGHTVEQYRASLVQTIGENIQIRRLLILKRRPNHSLGVYSHLGGKIVTAVEVEGCEEQEPFAKEIAMHVAAAAPDYLTKEEIPEKVIEHEREIAQSQCKGKPEFVVNKILEGKIRAFCEASCLLMQHYIRDDTITVEQLVERRAKEIGAPLKISRFLYWKVSCQ